MTEIITSANNASIKNIMSLTQKKYRDQQRLFFVEGWKNISEAMHGNYAIETLLVELDVQLKSSEMSILENIPAQCRVINTTAAIIGKIASTVTPQPLIAVVRYPETVKFESSDKRKFVLLLNDVQDPGNFGSIIRSAAAAGVEAVICDEGCADHYSQKVIRASAGAVFKLPVIRVENAVETVLAYKRQGHLFVGTALCKDAVPLWSVNLANKKIVVAVGNEGKGIDEELLALCDIKLTIPLKNDVESLNVGAAAAIVLFTITRK